MSSTENLINVGKHSNRNSGSGYSSDLEYENNNYHNTLSRTKPRGRVRLESTKGFENRGFEEEALDVHTKQSIYDDGSDASASTRTQHGNLLLPQVGATYTEATESRSLSPYYRTNTTNSAPIYSRVNKSARSPSNIKQRTRSSATEENLHRKAVLNNIKLRGSKSTSHLDLSESLEDDVFYPAENASSLTPRRQVKKQMEPSNEREIAASIERGLSQGKNTPLQDYTERIAQVVEERARLAEKLRLLRKNVESRNNEWTARAETSIGSQSNSEDVWRPGLLPNHARQSEIQNISTAADKNNPHFAKTRHSQETRQSDFRLQDMRPISQFSTKNRHSELITRNEVNNSNSRLNPDALSDEIGRRQTIESIAEDLWGRLASGEEFYPPDSGKSKTPQSSNRGTSMVRKGTIHSDNANKSQHANPRSTFLRNKSVSEEEKRGESIDKAIEEYVAFEKQSYEDQEETEQQKQNQQRETAEVALKSNPSYKDRQKVAKHGEDFTFADRTDSSNAIDFCEGQTRNGKEMHRCGKEEKSSVPNSPFLPRKTNNRDIMDSTTMGSGSGQKQQIFKQIKAEKASKTGERNCTPNATPRGGLANYMLPPRTMTRDHVSANNKKHRSIDTNPPVEIIYDSTAEQAQLYEESVSRNRERNQRPPDILGSKAAQKLRYYRSRSQTIFSNGGSEQTESPVTRHLSNMYITTDDPEVRREIQRQAAGEAAILRREASHLLWHAMNLERVCDPNARVRHVYMPY